MAQQRRNISCTYNITPKRQYAGTIILICRSAPIPHHTCFLVHTSSYVTAHKLTSRDVVLDPQLIEASFQCFAAADQLQVPSSRVSFFPRAFEICCSGRLTLGSALCSWRQMGGAVQCSRPALVRTLSQHQLHTCTTLSCTSSSTAVDPAPHSMCARSEFRRCTDEVIPRTVAPRSHGTYAHTQGTSTPLIHDVTGN